MTKSVGPLTLPAPQWASFLASNVNDSNPGALDGLMTFSDENKHDCGIDVAGEPSRLVCTRLENQLHAVGTNIVVHDELNVLMTWENNVASL